MERRTLDSCGKQRRFRPRSACRRPLKNCNIIIIVGGRLLNSGISFVFRGDISLSMGRAPSRFVTAFLQGLGLSRCSHRSRAAASPNQLYIRFQINTYLIWRNYTFSVPSQRGRLSFLPGASYVCSAMERLSFYTYLYLKTEIK
jgi:hypothetical protein